MIKHTISTFLSLFFVIWAFGQNYNLGKVSKEELEQKTHPSDEEAPAAILYKKGRSYFDVDRNGHFILVTEVEQRIKVYKKEAYSYANVEIPYYVGGVRDVKVLFSDAATYNLVNGQIEKTKLTSDSEFKEVKNEYYNAKKIILPNVKEGSIIEYKYVIRSPYYSSFPDWYFEYVIPADFLEYQVGIAEFFSYNSILRGYLKVEQSKMVSALSINRLYGEARVTYTATNVKAYKEEKYVNNIKNYISILEHELSETNFPKTGKEKYSTDWESVAKSIYEHSSFGRELNFSSYFEKDIDERLQKTTTNEEKMQAVFAYVQAKMNWNGKTSYYCDKGVKDAYKANMGNVAEINLMLTAMLRYAGLNANPVLLSTRDNGIAKYPNRNAFNYVIVAVEMPKGPVLLDATSKNTRPNILSFRALNWVGRLIRKDKTTREINLVPKTNSSEIITVLASMDVNGNVSGKSREQLFDYNALFFREQNLASEKIQIDHLEKKYSGIEIQKSKFLNQDEREKPIIKEYDFVHENLTEIIADKIYFSPMLYLATTENPFKLEKRAYPVDFPYPYQEKYQINIEIPEGYAIESLPKSLKLAMEEGIGDFSYVISGEAGKIQLVANFNINFSNVSPEYYQTLKDFFRVFIEKQNEKIILKKA